MNSQVDKQNRQKRLPQDLNGSNGTDAINQTKKSWLKKYDKDCPTNVDSHGIDKHKRDKYEYGHSGRTKTNL
jgi:hypothetical protein